MSPRTLGISLSLFMYVEYVYIYMFPKNRHEIDAL